MRPRTRPTTPPERTQFPDYFSGHAALYARARPIYPESLIAELAALAPGKGLAWDVGTGSGQAAHLLARHFRHVHATDASAKQIAEAEPHPKIDFHVALAEHSTLADASCDLVLAANALHWFDHDAFSKRRDGCSVRAGCWPGSAMAGSMSTRRWTTSSVEPC